MNEIFIYRDNIGEFISSKRINNLKLKFNFFVAKDKQFNKDLELLDITNYTNESGKKNSFILIFNKDILNLNLIKISIIKKNGGFIFSKDTNENSILSFWVFVNNSNIYSYPLSIIIWPPAIKYQESIINDIKKRYKIRKQFNVSINNTELEKFMFYLYKDDKRCDLPSAIKKRYRFTQYPNTFKYIQISVKDPKLNNYNISKLAINFKNFIRKKYKPLIKNYFYDIIIHMSDNKRHSNIMDKVCITYKNNNQYKLD